MKSIVCVKRVPDTETRIRISGGETSVEAAGVKYVLNPYDEFALEAALKQKEGAGEGQVTAITVGGAEGAEALRSALAIGADDAVLLRAGSGLEGLAVAKLLAEEIRGRSYDLLLFGMKAVHGEPCPAGPIAGRNSAVCAADDSGTGGADGPDRYHHPRGRFVADGSQYAATARHNTLDIP